MAHGINLFTNRTITQTTAAPSQILPISMVDFISVGINVVAIGGTNPTATFGVQWSFDGDTWTNPMDIPDEDVIAAMTSTGVRIKRMPVKAPYWRLAAQLGGTNPSFTVTGNALVF
jgi:hypothetical protein